MADYIDRGKFLKKLNSEKVKAIVGVVGLAWVKSLLSKIPSADVVEVRHGEWVRNVLFNGTHTCSVCGNDPIHYDGSTGYVEVLSDYCPNCGAKMDGKDGADAK